ncbi:MAG: twitching motility protein PilT [Chloroflexota bacterium]
MSNLVLDAGALIAVERGDRTMMARLAVARENGDELVTNAAAVAQAWRDGSTQVRLVRLLHATKVSVVDLAAGQSAGELLGRSGTHDVVDATVTLLARSGDIILTSDPIDLGALAEAAGIRVRIVPC